MNQNRKSKIKNQKSDYGLLLALIIPLFAIMPLLTHAGLPNTADGPAHLMRQVELNQAWQQGDYYPRWGTDLALGHGMPIFSYAPPSLYQATQLFHTLGLPLDAAMKAVLVVVFFLYSLGMFLLARRIYGVYPALLAAAVYVYAPYRLREAYIQGNYGQFIGLACYPFIFWAFHGLITDGRPRYLIASALSLAALLLSHNISSMLFIPILAIYLIFLLIYAAIQQRFASPPPISQSPNLQSPNTPKFRPLLQTTFAGLLGLGLAAIFWLPAFGERHDIKLEGITQGFFDFRENFIAISEFFAPPLPLDLTAINPEFPLSLGLPQIIGATLGIITILIILINRLPSARPNRQSLTVNSPFTIHHSPFIISIFFTLSLLLYTYLSIPLSQPAWEAIPLLELAEFPWRMLGPAIFFASLLAAPAFFLFQQGIEVIWRSSRLSTPGLTLSLLIFIVIVLNAYYLYPSQFIKWGSPSPADAFEYEVISGAIGTTSTGEFLPSGAQQHPQADTLWPDYQAGQWPQKIDPTTLPTGATIEATAHLAELDAWQIITPESFIATIRTLYWPGWHLYLDNRPHPFTVTPHTGLIQTTIPSGDHALSLRLESTPLRTTGTWLTILSTVTLVVLTFTTLYRKNSQPPPPNHSSFSIHHSPLTIAFLVALLLTFYLLSRPLASLFVLQSGPNFPLPASHQVQVDFADQLRLVGTSDLPQTVELGGDLSLTLFWRAQQVLDTNYSIFVHLDAPHGQTFVTVDETHPENIPTRNWPPSLYLRNPVHLEIPADIPPLQYALTLGVYDPETGQRLALQGDQSIYQLGTVWVIEPESSAVPQSAAHFGETLTLHQPEFDGEAIHLIWQTIEPVPPDHTIFVHLLDKQGNLLAQLDGQPYDGLYPLENWRPTQLIRDDRRLNQPQPALSTISIGIYHTFTGTRLPATDAEGNPLPNNAFILTVSP